MIPFRACVYDLSFEREHSEVRWKYEESQKVSKNIHFIFDWPHSWMHMQQQAQNIPVVILTYLTFIIELSFTTSGISIAALFTTYTKGKHMQWFLWAEGGRSVEIHWRSSAQFGDDVFTQLNGVTDEDRSGCPSTMTTKWNAGQLHVLTLDNRRETVDEVANQLQISHGSSYEIVFHRLHIYKLPARWIPKQHRHNHLDICTLLLNWNHEEGYAFLSHIVMGEETWIHH